MDVDGMLPSVARACAAWLSEEGEATMALRSARERGEAADERSEPEQG